jgi:hypothetical protein
MKLGLAALVPLAVCAGCGTTSTITRVNGPAIEGHIVGGDAENVYVGPKDAPQAIPRSEITDIDYPGDGATIAGAILAGYGVVNIAVGAPQCGEKGAAFCTGVFAPLAVGIPIFLWGRATHASAVNAAKMPPYRGGARILVTPVVGTQKGEPSGAAIVGQF